jgi:fimbrial chaperone protein
MTHPKNPPNRSALRGAALGAAALLFPLLANAASLEIDPVRIDLTPKQQTAVITIRNSSDQPTTIEIKPVAWSQVDSKDVNTETKELLVSPPIVTIPAHGSQIVRAALRRQPDPTRELAYRINLQEVPPVAAPGVTGVQVALRIGLPVFVKSKNSKSAPKMEWSVLRKADGDMAVVLHNPGTAHIQVSDFSLLIPGSNTLVASEQGSSYVLAGQTREWNLKPIAPENMSVARLRLKVFTDAGDADQELPLDRQ